MRMLILFYTQSEAGAPGYLSRRGEDAAQNLSESVCAFLTDSLMLELAAGYDDRARSISEDIRWKAYKKQDVLTAAVAASLALYQDVLLMSGGEVRSLKTAEALAQLTALPVCVDERLDRAEESAKGKPTLKDALSDLIGMLFSGAVVPKCVLVGTSLPALTEWISDKMETEKFQSLQKVFAQVTEGGQLPVVFACGVERNSQGQVEFIFD